MSKRVLVAALSALLLLVLAACQAGTEVVVHADGSGKYSTTLSAEGAAGESLYKAVVAAAGKSGVPLTVKRFNSGGESGAELSCTFRSLDDLAAMSARLGAAAGSGIGGVRVAKSTTGWTFAASSKGVLLGASGSSETGAPGGAIDPTQLLGMVHMSVAVTLPGLPGVNNATASTHTDAATRFTWSLDASRTAGDLHANTTFVGNQKDVALATALTPLGSPSSGGSGQAHHSSSGAWAWWLVGGAVLALMLAAAVGIVVRHRQSVAAQSRRDSPPESTRIG